MRKKLSCLNRYLSRSAPRVSIIDELALPFFEHAQISFMNSFISAPVRSISEYLVFLSSVCFLGPCFVGLPLRTMILRCGCASDENLIKQSYSRNRRKKRNTGIEQHVIINEHDALLLLSSVHVLSLYKH